MKTKLALLSLTIIALVSALPQDTPKSITATLWIQCWPRLTAMNCSIGYAIAI